MINKNEVITQLMELCCPIVCNAAPIFRTSVNDPELFLSVFESLLDLVLQWKQSREAEKVYPLKIVHNDRVWITKMCLRPGDPDGMTQGTSTYDNDPSVMSFNVNIGNENFQESPIAPGTEGSSKYTTLIDWSHEQRKQIEFHLATFRSCIGKPRCSLAVQQFHEQTARKKLDRREEDPETGLYSSKLAFLLQFDTN